MNLAQSLLAGTALLFFTRVSVAKDFVVEDGLTLQARAYIDKDYKGKDTSRYDMRLQSEKNGSSWDFTFDSNPVFHYKNISGNFSEIPYSAQQKTTSVKLTLHQFEILDERLAFKDLNLMPNRNSGKNSVTPRFLAVDKALTATTPSGISITIPKQKYASLFEGFANRIIHGNLDALFFDVETTPNTREVVLPQSPLYQQYKKPVTIKFECESPNFMVWYMADNTFKRLAVGLPNLATIQRLDDLTIIVRQRVELRSIPVVLQVPVETR